MPVMSKPSARQWGDHPVIQGLLSAGSRIGLDDPQAVMGVGAPPSPSELTEIVPGVMGRLRGAISGPGVEAATQSARDVLNPIAARNMDALYKQAHPAFRALQDAGAFIGDRTVGGLHHIAGAAGAVGEKLGEYVPEFTPVGGEALYNLGKAGAKYVPRGEDLVRWLGGMRP